MKLASQIERVLNIGGPRRLNVLRGLAKSDAEFERAIGILFLRGVVRFISRKRWRMLARGAR